MTLQLAVGFTLTVATIWLIPILEDVFSWRWAFASQDLPWACWRYCG